MDGGIQRTLAIWTMLTVVFVLFAGFLSARGELTLGFVGTYWLTPVVVTAIGILPLPWAVVTA
jgi:hypothetical protein